MSEDKKREVGDPMSLYLALNVKWTMIKALKGGTQTMRDAETLYLPKEAKETKYDTRLARSFLFNAYRDSVEKIVAKPFSRMVTLKNEDKLPDQLQGISADADRAGTSLTNLARELLEIAIDEGLVHVWVDYPRVTEQPNLKEQRDQDIRPFFTIVRPSDVIGWQSEKDSTGRDVLTQVRVREWRQENSGDYDMVSVEHVRVLMRDGWELWQKQDDGDNNPDWKKIEEGTWNGFVGVPLVTAYLKRTGFMAGAPVMEDLAWLNIAHWQSSSDQRNILRFARTGLVFVKGMSQAEIEEQGGIVLGPNTALTAVSSNADAKIVEHSGSAIGAGAEDLKSLEQQMQVLGLQPFFRLTGGATATEKMIDESRSETEIQAWIKAVESLITQCYEMAARWIGEKEIADDFSVDIYNDFVLGKFVDRDLQTLIKMRLNGDIDNETLLSEVKRRGIFGNDVTVEEIMNRRAMEGPNLAGIGGEPDAEASTE